jgi:RNA polymerase sigma-70 factor (ECF subfamily)
VEDRPPDTTLIERAQRGDREAYGLLVRRYETVAFRTAYLIAGSAADAEDAAQTGFVKGWRALGRFRAGAPFRPWILQIVANEARNRRRSAGRRAALAVRAAREPSGDAVPSPEASVVAAEERAELLAALDRLPDDHRIVLALRYLLDLSEEETAAALDVALGTVKSRTSRALARLREEVA